MLDEKKPRPPAFFAGIIGVYFIDETLAGGDGHGSHYAKRGRGAKALKLGGR